MFCAHIALRQMAYLLKQHCIPGLIIFCTDWFKKKSVDGLSHRIDLEGFNGHVIFEFICSVAVRVRGTDSSRGGDTLPVGHRRITVMRKTQFITDPSTNFNNFQQISSTTVYICYDSTSIKLTGDNDVMVPRF